MTWMQARCCRNNGTQRAPGQGAGRPGEGAHAIDGMRANRAETLSTPSTLCSAPGGGTTNTVRGTLSRTNEACGLQDAHPRARSCAQGRRGGENGSNHRYQGHPSEARHPGRAARPGLLATLPEPGAPLELDVVRLDGGRQRCPGRRCGHRHLLGAGVAPLGGLRGGGPFRPARPPAQARRPAAVARRALCPGHLRRNRPAPPRQRPGRPHGCPRHPHGPRLGRPAHRGHRRARPARHRAHRDGSAGKRPGGSRVQPAFLGHARHREPRVRKRPAPACGHPSRHGRRRPRGRKRDRARRQ